MIKEQLAQQVVWGVDGGAFGPRTQTVLTTTQVLTISQGFWLVELPGTNNTSLTFTPDAGTTTVVYTATTSAKTLVFSDGFSWFLSNSGSNQTSFLTQIKTMF